MNITIKINDQESWTELYRELKKCGLLQNIAEKDVIFGEEAFPIEIPVDAEGLLKMIGNPMVKPFRKKMNESLERTLKWVME